MKIKFLIFIVTGLIFAISLILCSTMKTDESTLENNSGAIEELKIQKSFKATPGYKLHVELHTSNIIMQSHDSTGINVDFYARGQSQRLEQIDILFDERGNSLTIKERRREKIPWFDFGTLLEFFNKEWIEASHFIITAPDSASEITLKSSSGNIKIKNLRSNFRISSLGGDIHGEELKGEIYASSSGGNIHLKNCNGYGEMKTAGGDIIISTYNGNIKVESSGGDIRINKLVGSLYASSSGGDIVVEFSQMLETTKLSSSGGDIKIYAPSNLNAYVELKSSGGDIKVDFPLNIETKTHFEVKGWIGQKNSSSRIKASTSGGDIKLVQKDSKLD